MNKLKELLSQEVIKTLRTVLLVIAGVFVFLFVQAQLKDRDSVIEKQIAAIEQYQKDAKKASQFADSLDKIADKKVAEAAAADARARSLQGEVSRLKRQTVDLRGDADSLKKTLTDSVELARRVIPLQDSVIAKQDSTIRTQDTQIINLTIAGAKKDTALTIVTFSRDSLQTIVNNAPKPPQNPNKLFGFINLPSRKVIAAVSAVAGAVVAMVIVK